MSLRIAEPLSIQDVHMDDGTVIHLRRHGNPQGPRLVLCHGNGLAIDCYLPFWSLLTNDFDLFMFDLRNHGWNSVGPQKSHHLPSFVEDHDRIIEAIDRYYGTKPKIGVYHSVSALASLLSPTDGSNLAGRVLFDPPVCKVDEYDDYPEEFDIATRRYAAMTRRRNEQFATFEECEEFLRYIPAFQRVSAEVRALFARTTLRACDNGSGLILRCPREYEAQIINYARAYAVLVKFENFRCPTKVIGADPILGYTYLPTFNLSHITSVDYDFLPNTTHFLQLEKPKECVELLLNFLETNNLIDS